MANQPPQQVSRDNKHNDPYTKTQKWRTEKLIEELEQTGQNIDVVELLPRFLHLVPNTLPPDKFVLKTLPAREQAVQDGDSLTVYCNTEDHENLQSITQDVKKLYEEISDALLRKNYDKAYALDQKMSIYGYRALNYENKEILAQKFRIRLRGIDAPDHTMPFDDEAKNGLAKLVKGKKLTILVYGKDRYDRFVGDIYCNGIFIQEEMLLKGLAWHYKAYDKRKELAKWEKKAREDRVGLWGSPSPEAPWKWKQKQRQV